MSVFELIVKYQAGLLKGFWTTLKLAALVWLTGISLGSVVASLGSRWRRSFGRSFQAIFFLIGSTPILVILFWLHYPAQSIIGVVLDPFWTAVIALSLVNVGLVSEIIRPVLEKFPREYIVVGKLCGLSDHKIRTSVYFPLVLRQVVPSILITQVAMLHATLFASLISVEELFRVVQQINSVEYQPVKLYTALALFYILISAPMNWFAYVLHKKFGRDLSEI